MRASDVIQFVGTHPRTYKTVRSRVERWCGLKVWMDRNFTRWDANAGSEDRQLYDLLAKMFHNERLQSAIHNVTDPIAADVVHAATISTRALDRRASEFARSMGIRNKRGLPDGSRLVA